MKKIAFVMGYLLLTILLAACGGNAEAPLVSEAPAADVELMEISLPMGYIADPQYAPFYVAIEKGYFAAEGYEITFDYSFETNGIEVVGANNEPFALVSGDVVLTAAAEEIPVLYVMEWFQKYPVGVMSKTAAGINEPADLIGRRVGLPFFFGATYLGYQGLLDANSIDSSSITAEEIGFTQVESLLTDQVDAVVVYLNNEPLQMAALGEEVNVIPVSDYIDMVANGIITNKTFAAEHPDRVAGFVRAVTRGLQDTLANPDEAFEISKKYVEGLEDDRKAVLEASLPLWEADQIGYTDPASWERTQEVLLKIGLLDQPLADLSALYTNEFLPQ